MWVIFDGYGLCEPITAAEARQLNENYRDFSPWAEWIEVRPGETIHEAANRAHADRMSAGGELLIPSEKNDA